MSVWNSELFGLYQKDTAKASLRAIGCGIFIWSLIPSKLTAFHFWIGRVWSQILSFERFQSYHKRLLNVCAIASWICETKVKRLSIHWCNINMRLYSVVFDLDIVFQCCAVLSRSQRRTSESWYGPLCVVHLTNNSSDCSGIIDRYVSCERDRIRAVCCVE